MKLALLILAVCTALTVAQLPIDPKGRPHPYITTVTIQATSTVTTIYQVKYLRVIESSMDATNTIMETNYIAIRTNVLFLVNTNTLVVPQ